MCVLARVCVCVCVCAQALVCVCVLMMFFRLFITLSANLKRFGNAYQMKFECCPDAEITYST